MLVQSCHGRQKLVVAGAAGVSHVMILQCPKLRYGDRLYHRETGVLQMVDDGAVALCHVAWE